MAGDLGAEPSGSASSFSGKYLLYIAAGFVYKLMVWVGGRGPRQQTSRNRRSTLHLEADGVDLLQ